MPTELGDFHQPHALLDSKGFKEKYKKAIKHCREGLPPQPAIELAFDCILDRHKFAHWLAWAIEDMEDGFTEEDSNLIKLMVGLSKEDAALHKRLSRKAIDIAESGNQQMLQFLLKTRYDYSEKSKKQLELKTDEAPIKFEIIDMLPNDDEEEID